MFPCSILTCYQTNCTRSGTNSNCKLQNIKIINPNTNDKTQHIDWRRKPLTINISRNCQRNVKAVHVAPFLIFHNTSNKFEW